MGSFIIVSAVTFLLLKLSTIERIQGSLLREERKLLNGRNLRASGFTYQPCLFSTRTPSGNYSYNGFCYDIVSWIAERFNMKLVFVQANMTEVAKNGFPPTLIKQIVREEVDIIPWALAPTPSLLEQLDFTIPLRVEEFILLQQWPKEESRLTAPIRPFSFKIWLMFLISIGAVIVVMALLTYCHEQWDEDKTMSKNVFRTVSDHSIYVATIITMQGNKLSQKASLSLHLTVGLWCLTLVVLINAYTGKLTAYLAVPKLEPIVNTLIELAASRDKKLTMDFESDLSKMFLRATTGPYAVIGNWLRNEPELLIKIPPLQGVANILQRNSVYPVNRIVFQYLIATDLKAHGNRCRMTGSDPIPYVRTYSFGLPKASRHNWIINHDLQFLWENGLLEYWLKKYSPRVDKCMIGKIKPRGKMTVFSLVDLSGAFALLVLGYALSLVLFILEIIVSLAKRPKNLTRVQVIRPYRAIL